MGVNMLLTIGGVILFSTFVLYTNVLMFDNVKVSADNEFVITAISLAQSVIDEAKMKAFDENTVSGSVTSPSSLTPSNSLSSEGSGEAVSNPDTAQQNGSASLTKFDDIDDYNGYVRLVDTPRAENYRIETAVNYASETYPDSIKSSQTFCKKMTVTVTSPFIPQPIRLSYAFTY
jgi:hypothetical protein